MLATFEDLLCRWNPRINLISRHDLQNVWQRHILDSAQVFDVAPPCKNWLDLGSGAGFPGLICAIRAVEESRNIRFVLVESDARKCAFLTEAVRVLDLPVTVQTTRIESLPPQVFDVITARALAPLSKLLTLAYPFCGPQTTCLFPKGARAESELTEARATWHTTVSRHPSRTDPGASILSLTDITPRQ